MTVIKKSNWGGKRVGAGRKPLNDHQSREIYKIAFDEVITEEHWKSLLEETLKTRNWKMLKYFIDQRIGKASAITSEETNRTVRIVLGDTNVD